MNSEVNPGFNTFLVNGILDKHAPIKVIEKKGNKITSKPLVIRGIKTSMKIGEKFYKQMLKNKTDNKNYQNTIDRKSIGIK